jgi:heat shock protein HtpX
MAEGTRPVLVYDQIATNERRALILLAIYALIALPSMLYASAAGVALFALATSVRSGADGPRIAPTLPLSFADFVIATAGLAIVLLFGLLLFAYWAGSGLILTAVRARALDEREEPELRRVVDNLCIGSGLPPPRLYLLEEAAPNAFAVGNDPHHAAIVVTRGLLELMDRDELQGVIAHELSHIGNRDTAVSSLLVVLTGLLHFPRVGIMSLFQNSSRPAEDVQFSGWLYLTFIFLWTIGGLPTSRAVSSLGRDVERMSAQVVAALPFALPALALLYVIFVAPWLADLARAALSREQESRADADAALLTRNPQGLAEALAKIQGATEAQVFSATAVSQLCIVDPLGGDSRTHPAIRTRIVALSMMAGTIIPADLEAAAAAGAAWAGEVPAAAVVARGAFRLTGDCTLYDGPNFAARQIGELRAGAIVVLVARHADFFRVITPADTFAFLQVRTPMEVVPDDTAVHFMAERMKPVDVDES